MSAPLVSVVMAVCNADSFLAEAIQSILDQSLTDFEFVIVDYGSTDNSKSIISSSGERDKRIKYFDVPPCVLPEARNAGCSHAQGRYIAIMDGDDVALPDRLAREVDYMEKHPLVAIVGGAVEWIDSFGKPFHVHRHPTGDREIKHELLTHSVFWHPTVVMRKDALLSVGGYRSAFVCAHDYDLAIRIAEKYDCANLDEIVLRYRVHPLQLTSHRQKLQSLCKLAARASASARRLGHPDPLDGCREITSSTLSAWGVGEPAQRNAVVSDGHIWIRSLMSGGEHAAALVAARQILESNLDHVEPWHVSELHLLVAAIHWREKRIWKCTIAVGQAILARPIVIGRPLKQSLRRLGIG
jgi:Glycosyl transferase family 2